MENLKHTKKYAEQMRLNHIDNFKTTTFEDGYMSAIKESAAPDLLKALLQVVSDDPTFLEVPLIANAIKKATE